MLPQQPPRPVSKSLFDDRRLVANAGLLLPATLARHLGLPELVRPAPRPGRCAPGRANTERQDDDAGGVCAGWGRLY